MTQSEKILVTKDGTEISADWIREFTKAFQEEMARAASEAKAAENVEEKCLDSTSRHVWEWVKQKGEIAADAFAYALGSGLGQALVAAIVFVVLAGVDRDRREVQS